MYIHGSFISQRGDFFTVHILTSSDRSKSLEIGNEDDGVLFTDNPAEIKSEMNDTFDHLLPYSATINLQVADYMSELFCNSCRDAVVNIYRGDECIFAGYVEPQTYSQSYNEIYDELSLNCIDCLSALQYSNYADIGSLGVSYSVVKGKAKQRTFLEIVKEIMGGVTSDVDILGGSTLPLYFDGSKMTKQGGGAYSIFADTSISELLFLGDEEDDVWTHEDVLKEILKYLDLHIVQVGLKFFVFSWSTIRNGNATTWSDLMNGGTFTTSPSTIDVTSSLASDCDTQITVAESYNQLLLTDNVTEIDNVVENPLDSSSLSYAFGNYQKYMTEYIAEGEGVKAIKAFGGMINGSGSDWSDASQVDWYAWVKKNSLWNFYMTDSSGKTVNVYDTYCQDGTNQQDVLKCLSKGVGAAVVAFGSVEKKNGGSDNSPASAPEMKDYLVIGLGTIPTANYKNNDSSSYLTDGTKILAACPVAEYIGNTSGGNFSPSDDNTTHYIQISGKLTLNPIMNVTDSFSNLYANKTWEANGNYWHRTVASRNNDDGRYYARKYWKATSWKDDPSVDTAANNTKGSGGVYPFTGTGPQNYEYDYNTAGETKDTVSKVGVLQCMLIVGDKCVVETLPENGGSGDGSPDDFTWQTFKERSECASDDEYYQQSFAIGFDPKLKDKIIGTEFDIQKNAAYTIGVTVEGTMIPIRRSDKVSGQVRFYILGPVNEEWLNVTKRHKTFFRHTKYYEDSVHLLEHTSSIMVRDFEVKVVSDNGKMGTINDESDIIYMSDTKEKFVNKKDDLEMKITTALTSDECSKLGVNNAVKLSSPVNATTKDALLSIYDTATSTTAKPEQIYVDAYWQEWHDPRVEMEQGLEDDDTIVSLFNLYRHPAIGKTFYVEGIDRNLIEGTVRIKMKETF